MEPIAEGTFISYDSLVCTRPSITFSPVHFVLGRVGPLFM